MAQQPTPAPTPVIPTVKMKAKAGFEGKPVEMDINPAVGDLKPWDLDTKFDVMKGRYPRIEGPLKVTGKAKYTYDIKLPGMLWGRMVGSSVPHAEVVKIDTSKAEKLPGVKAVWTTESRTVRFAGQDIAAVAATTPEIALDAARLIEVTYNEKPFITDLEKAMEAGAPPVYSPEQVPGSSQVPRNGNILGPQTGRGLKRGDVVAGLSEADVSVESTYRVSVHTHSSLETHGVIAQWEGDELTIYASTQGVFTVKEGVAEALGIPRTKVRVITEHMGGGFGSKLAPSATGSQFAVVACRLAKSAGAPVKLMLDRKQEHLCTGNAPSALMTVNIGAKKDGTFTAIHHRSFGSAGIAPGAGTAAPLVNLYQTTPNILGEDHSVFTNAGPAAPLRAPGHPQGAFALESAIDELAEKMQMDPVELRKKNDPSPVRQMQYDIGAKAIGWERRSKKAGDAKGPIKRGIGMANGEWSVNARGSEVGCEVRIHRDGSVECFSGAQDIGSGFRTAMAVVTAEELGLRPKDITMHVGDTRWPFGPASGGSNTTNSVAPAVRMAAHDAKKKLFAAVAPSLGAKPEELEAHGGKVFVAAKPTKSLTFKQAAAKIAGEQVTATAERKKQYELFRTELAGTQFCEVEVDTETGEVKIIKMVSVNDCGIPVNSLTTESQVIGAMIQGASWALFENRTLDRSYGTMVNPNLEWYKILMPTDMFEAVSILTPIANLGNNTSTAGIGEPCSVPVLAAIANAIFNATGARVRSLPITPDRMLAALAEARRRA
ncbi:MAG TPA: xanthine dehydrogenase family protein molybdopterin-binding subunit [Vicinamibacteria bacterium]|nr:xanthine dehydrogenase family protein molybdopterin-binding subunit [Vicinamibacteria bacterium]